MRFIKKKLFNKELKSNINEALKHARRQGKTVPKDIDGFFKD